jgi:hypothetical protein
VFDAEWATNGLIDRAVELFVNWIKVSWYMLSYTKYFIVQQQSIPGLEFEVLRAPNRTPLIFITVESTAGDKFKGNNILMYGHLDKVSRCTIRVFVLTIAATTIDRNVAFRIASLHSRY